MEERRPFSLLTDSLPDYIELDGRRLEIYTDTMTALQCLTMIDDEDIPEAIRVSCVIEATIKESGEITPSMYVDAFSAILRFLKGYRVEGRRSSEQLLSYSQDHALIVASFRQAYGMDIEDIQRTHWWEFQALLSGLPEDTRLSQVIALRGREIDPKAPPAEKMRLQKAKALVRIRKRKRKGETGYDIVSRGLVEGDRLNG